MVICDDVQDPVGHFLFSLISSHTHNFQLHCLDRHETDSHSGAKTPNTGQTYIIEYFTYGNEDVDPKTRLRGAQVVRLMSRFLMGSLLSGTSLAGCLVASVCLISTMRLLTCRWLMSLIDRLFIVAFHFVWPLLGLHLIFSLDVFLLTMSDLLLILYAHYFSHELSGTHSPLWIRILLLRVILLINLILIRLLVIIVIWLYYTFAYIIVSVLLTGTLVDLLWTLLQNSLTTLHERAR